MTKFGEGGCWGLRLDLRTNGRVMKLDVGILHVLFYKRITAQCILRAQCIYYMQHSVLGKTNWNLFLFMLPSFALFHVCFPLPERACDLIVTLVIWGKQNRRVIREKKTSVFIVTSHMSFLKLRSVAFFFPIYASFSVSAAFASACSHSLPSRRRSI